MSTEDIFDLILGPEPEEPKNPIDEFPIDELLDGDPRVSTTEPSNKIYFFRDILKVKEL